MASLSITFFKSPTTVTITGRVTYGSGIEPGRSQKANAAMGGRIVVTNLDDGTVLRRPKFTCERVSDADKTALVSFIETTVDRRSLPFTFTDWEGDSYTVHYWNGINTVRRQPAGKWEFTLELREVPT